MAFGIMMFALAGLAFGSFGNVLIYRLHTKEHITGRSMCMSCHRTLQWFELFPVLSYVVLRGACRTCRQGISLQYPLVEFGSALVFVLAFVLHPFDSVTALVTAFALYFVLLACVFDARYQQVPDLFTLFIAFAGIIGMILSRDAVSPLVGAVIMLAWFGGQWIISRGRAVGTGDIFLASAIGLVVGWKYALMTLIFSYMAGAVILIAMILLRMIKAKQQRIAYVPFLTIGLLLTLLGVGDAYLKIIGF